MHILFLLKLFALFPIRTDRSLRAIPYATYSLLFLNIFVYLFALHLTDAQFYAYKLYWGLTLAHPTLFSLFTHAFIHADWMHLLGNMLVLWIVGTVLESGIGSVQFLLLYLASLLAAILLNGIVDRLFIPEELNVALIGASGAIAGITGFAAFRYYHIRVQNFIIIPTFGVIGWLPVVPIPIPIWTPFWIYPVYFGGKELLLGIGNLFPGGSEGIAHWAHLGGMGLGLLAAVLLRSFQEGQRERALEQTTKAANGDAAQQARSLDDLHRLLRQHPDDPEVLEALAGLALANGELESSRILYLKAIPIFFKNGQMDRAAISYLNLYHHFPDVVFSPREQLALASTLESLGRHVEAADAFALIHRHHPESDEAQTGLLRAAQIHDRRLQSAPDALETLHILLDNYPATPWENIAKERMGEIQRRMDSV